MKKINNMRFRKTDLKLTDEISFDFDLLKLYLAIDENKSVSSIFKETQLEIAIFKECFITLFKRKLIEPAEGKKIQYVNGSFYNRLREVLIDASGPLGDILIEEVAEEMNVEPYKIPKEKLADFINKIAASIPSDKQSSKFREIMLREIEQ